MKSVKHKIAKLLRGWSKKLDPEFCPIETPPVDPCINLRASVYDIDRLQVCVNIIREEAKYVPEHMVSVQLSEKIAKAMLESGAIKITREDNPDGSRRYLAETFVGKKKYDDRQF